MKKFLQIAKERLIGKHGWYFTALGIVIINMAMYMWWHSEISTTDLGIGVTIGTGLVWAKAKTKDQEIDE